jgi:hypothetical protein
MNGYWSNGVCEARERAQAAGGLGVPSGGVARAPVDGFSRKRWRTHPVKSVAAQAALWFLGVSTTAGGAHG